MFKSRSILTQPGSRILCFAVLFAIVASGMTTLAQQGGGYDEALKYLSDTDSIIAHEEAEGDQLASILLQRGKYYHTIGRPVRAVQSLKDVSDHTDDASLLAQASESLGDIYLEQKSYNKAMEHYGLALRQFDAANDPRATSVARFKTATVYHKLGNEEMAEGLLIKVLADTLIDPFQKALVHETLGEVYYRLVDYNAARDQWLEANKSYPALGMRSERLDNYLRILQTYSEEKNFTEARPIAEEIALLARSIEPSEASAKHFATIAAHFKLAGDIRYAIEYQEQAAQIIAAHPAGEAAEIYAALADLYIIANRDAEALLAYEDAAYHAKKTRSLYWQEHVARRRARFFHIRERFDEAYQALSMADSISNVAHQQELAELQSGLETEKFSESSYLRTEGDLRTGMEERKMANMRNLLVIGAVFFIIILFLLIREFGQKKKLSKVLEWKVYKRTRELRKANKELNTYIYKSSHDLRTPLTSIKSLLRLLEKEEHNASTKKYLGLIQSCTDQMDDILVNLSRAVDYKKVDLKVEQIDFNKLKYQIQEKELANVKGIKIIWDIQEAGVFFSDFKLLKVILQQTITNAVAYRKGGEDDYCKVSIYTDPSGASLTIEDNGQGISEKVKDKVFDMFVKGTHKSTGAGLGLYLVRIAVDKIRAKVSLESEEHRGCTLRFELPNLN